MRFLKFKKEHTSNNEKKTDLRRSDLIEFGAVVLVVIFVNIISHFLFFRLDLTAEKRYTLAPATKEMLRNIKEPVLFRIYLDGDLPADFKRLQDETKEMLNQFRSYNSNVNYEFVDPNHFDNPAEQNEFYKELYRKGIQPTQVRMKTSSGYTTMAIVPAADVTYAGRSTTIQLLQDQKYVSQTELLNNSVQNLEYALSNAIHGLARGVRPKVGFMIGHGELNGGVLYDIQSELYKTYDIDTVSINGRINALTTRTLNPKDSTFSFHNNFDLLIIAKPRFRFSDQDLYLLDQYVMYGGSILWLIDPLSADMDSLATQPKAIAVRLDLGLDEMLFNYGVRLNSDLVQDIRCRPIPMTVGHVGNKPQLQFCPWLYFPELIPSSQHPIVRNLDIIKSDFASSITPIDNDIEKTILLTTSEYSRVKNAPVIIDLNEANLNLNTIDERLFNRPNLPVAYLLEGNFKSMWRSRLAPQFTAMPEMGFRDESEPNKMIVIADGDIIKNHYSEAEGSGYPMGYDHYTQTTYANKQFILNAVDYLTGGEGFMASRGRNVQIRKLNMLKGEKERLTYQIVNTLVPSAIILLVAVVIIVARKRNRVQRGKHTANKTQN